MKRNPKRKKLASILFLALLIASCAKELRGVVTDALIVEGTASKSSTTTGFAVDSEGGVSPVFGTSSYTVPAQYGVLKIDMDGDGLTDDTISIDLTSDSAAKIWFRSREMLDQGRRPEITYKRTWLNTKMNLNANSR